MVRLSGDNFRAVVLKSGIENFLFDFLDRSLPWLNSAFSCLFNDFHISFFSTFILCPPLKRQLMKVHLEKPVYVMILGALRRVLAGRTASLLIFDKLLQYFFFLVLVFACFHLGWDLRCTSLTLGSRLYWTDCRTGSSLTETTLSLIKFSTPIFWWVLDSVGFNGFLKSTFLCMVSATCLSLLSDSDKLINCTLTHRLMSGLDTEPTWQYTLIFPNFPTPVM